MTAKKRGTIAERVLAEVKAKNPLRPTIARKSITLASNTSDSELRRPVTLSQREHSQILTTYSAKKQTKKEQLRKKMADVEVLECSFHPQVNAKANRRIGFQDQA